MSAAQLAKTILVLCIGGFYSFFALCFFLWKLVTKGPTFFQVKQRDSAPECLHNDSFGTHHYVELTVCV